MVIWGEVLWDRFPDGDQLGGAPANVAWHLGMARGWARLVSRVGDDELGRRAITRLDAWVDTSLVQVDAERATGEVGVAVIGGEPRYTLHADRAWERIACTDAVELAIAEAGVFVYGTLAQRTAEGHAAWRRAIAAADCLRVCDVNLRRLPNVAIGEEVHDAIASADVIKVNDRELELLGGLAALRSGKQVIAVTHGADGSTLHGDGAPVRIPGVRASVRGDNVGCGDAYLAILVLGMTRGWDLADSGRAASRWAAAVAEARGATPELDDARIAALLGDDE